MNALTAIRPTFPSVAATGLARVPGAPSPVVSPADLREAANISPVRPTGEAQAPNSSFASLLGRMVTEVSAKQAAAGQTVQGLQTGQAVTVHQAMIAMEEASVSFQLMAEVRNRLLESYQELMRMQV